MWTAVYSHCCTCYSILHTFDPLLVLLKGFCNSGFILFVVVVVVVAAVAHETDGTVSSYWYTDRKFTIVVTAVLVILPLSIPKEISFQKYARYKPTNSLLWHTWLKFFFNIYLCLMIMSKLFCPTLCSALSVMGTWYVTIVVIIKYIWPDKEVIPGYSPTRWVLYTLYETISCFFLIKSFCKVFRLFATHSSKNICILILILCLSC